MRHTCMALTLLLGIHGTVSAAGGYWIGPAEPGVATNNDCGIVSLVSGSPIIRRAFMAEDDIGVVAFVAARLNAGDTVEVPFGDRLELSSGNNVVIVLGPGAKARFSGMHAFSVDGSTPVTRLDLRLLAGNARIQVRLNRQRPESVLIVMDGAEALLTRGDVEVSAENGWYASSLAGDAEIRLRRGGVAGAPFRLPSALAIGNNGENRLDAEQIAAVRERLPFSFELIRAALPPRPVGSASEAP